MSENLSKSVFLEGELVTLSANFRRKGRRPRTTIGVRKPFVWYKNIRSVLFDFVTKHAYDRQTEGRTDGQNFDSQDRASIAASRSK